MSKTLVQNVSLGPFTFPMPYQGVLASGELGVVPDSPDVVAAVIGTDPGMFRLSEVSDDEPTTIPKVSASNLPDGSVGTAELAALAVTTAKIDNLAVTAGKLGALAVETAKIAANAVTKAKALVFVSPAIVGDGTAQSTAHGLGAIPAVVMISLVGSPDPAYAPAVVTPGAHTNANVIATVTTGWSYQIFAWA